MRLTGGEPLLRRDLDKLVAMLAGIDGIGDIALTTNGALLPGKAAALAAAGLDVRTTNGWRLDEVVPAAEIISVIGRHWAAMARISSIRSCRWTRARAARLAP